MTAFLRILAWLPPRRPRQSPRVMRKQMDRLLYDNAQLEIRAAGQEAGAEAWQAIAEMAIALLPPDRLATFNAALDQFNELQRLDEVQR